MGKHWEIKSNVIPSDDYFTKESTISMWHPNGVGYRHQAGEWLDNFLSNHKRAIVVEIQNFIQDYLGNTTGVYT
jgi:trehalose-6-phosphatase